MTAALALHVALCQRLDAIEAYRLTHAYRDEVLAQQPEPLMVSRFDTAIEPSPEEAPVLTVEAIAEDGRPVALLLDEETRAKVASWLGAGEQSEAYDGELAMLRTLVRTLRVAARQGDLPAVQQALVNHAVDDANAREGFTVRCGSCPTIAPLAVAAKEWQTTSGETWKCPACAGGSRRG